MELEEATGLPVVMLKRMCKEEERAKLEVWMKAKEGKAGPCGRRRWWKRFVSEDRGIRLGQDGAKKKTFESFFQVWEKQVAAWARRELEEGWALSQQDLADEFVTVLDSAKWELEAKQEIEGCLRPEDMEKLKLVRLRL